MFAVKDLITQIDYADVQKSIERYYGSEKNEQLKKLYELLIDLQPAENKDGLTLYIWTYELYDHYGLRYSRRIDDYNEVEDDYKPEDLRFDVYGLEDSYDDDLVYSIRSAGYKNFLAYYVAETTAGRFTKESLLAHFLWELGRDGFDESRIR